ncbi:hypothetical protein [Neisseria sp. Ec49-e6-T10]|uniref:hypothetical protein n=1 Tax=Neisseria sp. Ec49-e6-T10 TaxID=3140744 RepID=UPI003EBD48D1
MNKAFILPITVVASLSLSACMVDVAPNYTQGHSHIYKYDRYDHRYRLQHQSGHKSYYQPHKNKHGFQNNIDKSPPKHQFNKGKNHYSEKNTRPR